MAYQKIYSREHWENFPSEKTAINRDRLNNIEGGIDAIDDRVCALDTTKVDLTKANELVKEILWDESNGTLTVVKMNGSQAMIDTKLEKLAVNFTYDSQKQQLIITLDDGTTQNVDLSSLITEYEFLDSDTIAFEIVDGKVKANVKNGSITEDHLSPDYLGEIRTQVGKAEMSAKSADASEKNAVSSSTLAKSYAVGGTGTRDGEDTDNARYYMEQAKAVSAVDIATTEKAGIVKPDGTTITADEDGTLHGVAKITVDTALSSTSTNPVQNKVVKDALDHKLKGYTITYTVPANTGGWHKIAQTTDDYFNFDLYTNGDWAYQPKNNAHFQIQNINGNVRIVQLSGLMISSAPSKGISKIRMVRVTDNKNIWILEEYSPSLNNSEKFKFTIAGDVTVTPLDGSVDTTTDFKDSVSLDVSDIPTGTVITTGNIDSHLNDIRKETTVNLLNPTVQTTTQNGVTCTNNGDGTYTLNGTATEQAAFWMNFNNYLDISKLDAETDYKIICTPYGGKDNTYRTDFKINETLFGSEYAEISRVYKGKEFDISGYLVIVIAPGYTCDNLVFKPMITTNLSATYDDFVPYTGDTGKLNGDVAELKAQSVKKADTISYDKSSSTLYLKSGSTVLSSTEIKSGGGATITPKPTVNPQIKNDDKKVVITWEDPTDTVIEGSTFSKWAGTKLVMKESGYPTSPDDGTVLVDNTTRDKYKTTGFTKDGLTNDKQYYFALFPYSTDGVYNYDSGNRLLGEPTELKIVTFADGTDAEIAKMIQAHYNDKINIADYWAVGDTRTVSLSAMSATGVGESHRAQTVQLVILGFEHDDLATAINGHSKAAVSVGLKDCLMDATSASNVNNGSADTEKGYMNSTNTNVGGWKNCARRTWCNNVFFSALPSTWQSMVKTVNKKVSVGNNSFTIETVQDKIFLVAEIEIFGSTNNSFNGEGTQYQYYKNATANKYKMPKWSSSGVSHIYWERSPRIGNSTYFCVVNNGGSADNYSASNAFGVAPCLCI